MSEDIRPMKTEEVMMHPEYAKLLLEKNTGNRRVRTTAVERYADLMKSEQWELTHQGIAISQDGTILDGQHRLMAVVKSGSSVRINLSTNVPKDSFKVIDQMIRRDPGDILGIDKRYAAVMRDAGAKLQDKWNVPIRLLIEINDAIGADVDSLISRNNGSSIYFSCTSFRLAAVVQIILNPSHKTEIEDIYGNFISGDISKLPQIGEHLYALVAQNKAKSSNSMEAFTYGISIFNPRSWDDRKKLRKSESMTHDARDALKRALELRGVNVNLYLPG